MMDLQQDTDVDRDRELRRLGVEPEQVVDERDVEYMLGAASSPQRDDVVCTLSTYRSHDRVTVGDRPENVELHSLRSSDPSRRLEQLISGRPVVLIFGSYT